MVGRQIQHYKIISELGEGGMGKVYKAFDTKLERFVAIKFLNPSLLKDSLFLDRFRTEGKNHAKLSHPNIVMVYGFIEYGELIGLIIEYVEGVTIEHLIEKYKRLNLIYSLKIIRQVLIALEYAHSKGLIHRDIKPSNIIIDQNGIAKLMDFGISKSVHSKTDLTRMGRNVGTVLYMSPEQINNQQSTAKTDLYSLAITLYEMLNGTPPYYYDNEFKIYEAHLKNIPNRLSNKFPDIPPEVDDLILSAMNKSSSVNYSSCFEFRKAVEELIFSLPVRINQITATSDNNRKEVKRFGRGILVPLFIILSFISLAGLSYLFVKNYLPRDDEKVIEKSMNFNTLKSNPKSEWQKLEVNTEGNLTDILIHNNKFYLSDDYGNIFQNDENFLFSSGTKLNINGINRILSYKDALIVLGNDGKVEITSKDLKTLRVIEISNESILSADIYRDKMIFCGGNGLVGILNLESYNFSLFTNVPKVDFFDIKFISENKFIAVGIDGIMLQSDDAGKNWSINRLSTNYLKRIVIHPNRDLIYLAGALGTVFYSQNKGPDWEEIKLKVTSPINDILFFDIKNFYAVNSNGDFIYSNDGGSSWKIVKTEYYIPLNRITTDGKNLYIIGNNGLLLKKNI